MSKEVIRSTTYKVTFTRNSKVVFTATLYGYDENTNRKLLYEHAAFIAENNFVDVSDCKPHIKVA